MNLFSLNCRGLGNPDVVGRLRNLIRREAPIVLFLCETKLSDSEMRKVRMLIDGYDGMEVDSVGRSGGLALLWQKGVHCVLRSMSVHYMDFDLEIGEASWRVNGFYGWPAVQDRHLSWQQLRLLAAEDTRPWLCIGDFNEILFSHEMKGGERPHWQMNNFRSAANDCGLRDVVLEGYPFTFDNGQVGADNRQCRLDRAMVTDNWLDIYPYARVKHLTQKWSDHTPLKLVLDGREGHVARRSRPFQFEQLRVGEEGCEEVIRRVWECKWEDLPETTNQCAIELRKWKNINLGKIVKTLDKKRRRLRVLDEGDRSSSAVAERKKLVKEIAQLLRDEEVLWRQRSRALWLKEGDKNTKFFHRQATQRKQKNHITKLIDAEGQEWVGNEAVAAVANSYFVELFAPSEPHDFDDVLTGVEGRVTTRMNALLGCEYREEEVLEDLNQMHPLKSPGPNGMNALFY
ncbi:uncharacterized protein LOC141632701 [Silene latifolia]|uniref:uncharacterized protein LOC141632701 n=1 Tax=Silene latifolia TaxID=37657 RepID=UPI003D76E5B3